MSRGFALIKQGEKNSNFKITKFLKNLGAFREGAFKTCFGNLPQSRKSQRSRRRKAKALLFS
ncbi:MAG: hypothetical protein LBK05_00595 [Treponema sp.]|nr:hypothetical protein [Treponema sp.]